MSISKRKSSGKIRVDRVPRPTREQVYNREQWELLAARQDERCRVIEAKIKSWQEDLVRKLYQNPLGVRVVVSGLIKSTLKFVPAEVDGVTVSGTRTEVLKTPLRSYFGACGKISYRGSVDLVLQVQHSVEDLVVLVPTKHVVIGEVRIGQCIVTWADGYRDLNDSESFWGLGVRELKLEGHSAGCGDVIRVTLLHEPEPT